MDEPDATDEEHGDEGAEEVLDPALDERSTSTREALTLTALGTFATIGAISFAFGEDQVGGPWMLGSLGITYGLLGAITVWRLASRGELDEQLRPRGGDLSIGALVAAVLYGVAMGVHLLFTSPSSPRSAWIIKIYSCLGDPSSEGRHIVGGVVFLIAALEELVWRGLIMRVLRESFGWLKSWLAQAVLFGLAHVPTMILLGDPKVGPNPLLVLAGVAYSLVWGRLAMRLDRLPPALFAHALFTWAVFEFPIWRP